MLVTRAGRSFSVRVPRPPYHPAVLVMTFAKAGPYHARAAIDTHEAHKVANFYVIDVPTPPLAVPVLPADG